MFKDDDNDLTARKAFESVLRVSLLQPTSPKFHNFSEIVRKVAAERYNYNFFEGEEVSDQVKSTYQTLFHFHSGEFFHRSFLRWCFTSWYGFERDAYGRWRFA